MSQIIVGRWGKNLAIRIPAQAARSAGLTEGESVEIETQDGDLVIRRSAARTRLRAEALAAADGITAESASYSLGGLTVRDLLDEGRRG